MSASLTDIETPLKLEENCEIIVPETGLKQKLSKAAQKQKPLNIKLGLDPTAPDIHLGHAVVLKKMKEFQDAGHFIHIIIGDFTAYIGDPTGRNKTRPPLSKEQIDINAQTYISQLSKVIDISKAKIHYNSSWFDQLNLRDMINLLSNMTLAQMIQRNDFSERLTNQQPIALHELIYPLLQGYDSLVIEADVEMGGTDQLFNCMVGKELQDSKGKPSQVVVCMPILRGTDGKDKMSKSKNNYIGLTDMPNDMYGKIMSIPDELLLEYLKLCTDFDESYKSSLTEKISSDPMAVKKEIAFNIVEQYHNKAAATEAEQFFYKQVQSRSLEEKDYEEISLSTINLNTQEATLLDLCHALMSDQSRSFLKKLVQGGGLHIEGEKVLDFNIILNTLTLPFKIKLGKRGFFQIVK